MDEEEEKLIVSPSAIHRHESFPTYSQRRSPQRDKISSQMRPIHRVESTRGTSRTKDVNSVPVRTEFVYTSPQSHSTVFICGDWANWAPIEMPLEKDCVWSVVTVVPSGYREFCYNVDGEFMVSHKHPTTADGSCNWRTVYGPPSTSKNEAETEDLHWFVEFSVSVSESIHRLFLARFLEAQKARRRAPGNARRHAGGLDAGDVEALRGMGGSARITKQGSWIDRPLQCGLCAISLYASVTIVFIVKNYLMGKS